MGQRAEDRELMAKGTRRKTELRDVWTVGWKRAVHEWMNIGDGCYREVPYAKTASISPGKL